PADPVKIGAANRALERLGVPWRFGTSRRGETTVSGAAPRPSVGAVADSQQAGPFVDVAAIMRYELVAQSGADADTVARVGREPWILAGPRYVIVGSPLDPAATTFPLRAPFVP